MNTQLTTKNNTTVTDLFACPAMQGSFCCLVCNSWYVGTYHFENESAANRIPYLLIYLWIGLLVLSYFSFWAILCNEILFIPSTYFFLYCKQFLFTLDLIVSSVAADLIPATIHLFKTSRSRYSLASLCTFFS